MPDLDLITINLENGVEQDALPGLVVLKAPRRTARGRENDLLVALSTKQTVGENQAAWFSSLMQGYFNTPGTLTFALRTLVENLNLAILERNLKLAKEGQRDSISLSLAVFRRNSLYLFNVGEAKSWYSGSGETLEFSDSENQGRGLGVTQTLKWNFSTREVSEKDFVVLSANPPQIWSEKTFQGSQSLSNDAAIRRMFNQAGTNFQAAAIRVLDGKGTLRQSAWKSRAEAGDKATTKAAQSIEDPGARTHQSQQDEQKPVDFSNSSFLTVAGERQTGEGQPIQTPGTSKEEAHLSPEIKGDEATDANKSATKAPVDGNGVKVADLKAKASKLTGKMVSDAENATSKIKNFLSMILPGITDEPLKLSRKSLFAIALGVPLVIALIAGAVYARVGKSREFEENLIMAQEYAIQAEVVAADEPMRLASLQQAMFWLDKAESYDQSEASTSLRLKVQSALDEMQGIQRLEMLEAVPGGLKAGSQIVEIVATNTDLYLLEDKSGTVKRYVMGSSGYEADEGFDCGPNAENPLNVMGNLVDILPLSGNNSFKATLLAIDASGNIEYCIPGESGITSSLVYPDQGWKTLTAAALADGYLYVLDSNGRAIYRYAGDGIQFDGKPTLFFDNQIPSLTEAIDIEVNGDELYILRSNGQMVECTYSHMKGYKLTECNDPAPYGDMRTGQQPEPISFPESNFIQMRLTGAPDSSIYLLDATARALYHFSLQRNLQKILHPRDLSGYNLDRMTPTAFAISSGRIAFMAFGNQIYYAALP